MFYTDSTTCSSGQIRLVSGPSPNEGRLEVCMGGTWGTVVDDGFQTVEAKVVCRQLGYADGCKYLYNTLRFAVCKRLVLRL